MKITFCPAHCLFHWWQHFSPSCSDWNQDSWWPSNSKKDLPQVFGPSPVILQELLLFELLSFPCWCLELYIPPYYRIDWHYSFVCLFLLWNFLKNIVCYQINFESSLMRLCRFGKLRLFLFEKVLTFLLRCRKERLFLFIYFLQVCEEHFSQFFQLFAA